MDKLTNEQEQSQACMSYAEQEGRRQSQLSWKNLECIPIPKGLEERLSAKIDEWERAEKKPRRIAFPKHLRHASVAASIALVLGLGYYTFITISGDSFTTANLAEQDTYQDPIVAQQEAERALNLLATNLNKGIAQLEKAKAISERSENTLNKQLKALE